MSKKIVINGKRIGIYGSKNQIEEIENMLSSLEITGNERQDRVVIQNALDMLGHKTGDILYDGNTVYPSKKLVAEIKRMRKSNSIEKMSNDMYKFLSLNFDIAHYNKMGYIDTYDGKYSNMIASIGRDIARYGNCVYTDIINIIELSGLKADAMKNSY